MRGRGHRRYGDDFDTYPSGADNFQRTAQLLTPFPHSRETVASRATPRDHRSPRRCPGCSGALRLRPTRSARPGRTATQQTHQSATAIRNWVPRLRIYPTDCTGFEKNGRQRKYCFQNIALVIRRGNESRRGKATFGGVCNNANQLIVKSG